MKWATVRHEGRTHAGLLRGDDIHLLEELDLSLILHDLSAAVERAGESGIL